MLILLSPAKSLNFEPTDLGIHTQARLQDETARLIKVLKTKSARSLKKLMGISDTLADLNVQRYQQFNSQSLSTQAKQAILAYDGDVYLGLQASGFGERDMEFAQDHLRILSGLYGLLRPLDLIQPHRLEMGLRLRVGRKKNLYEFWDLKITQLLKEDLDKSKNQVVLNLASQEYSKAIKTPMLKEILYSANFKELRDGKYKVIGFNAKKARGGMAREIIQNRITDIEDIKSLVVDGYVYNQNLSDEFNLVFVKE